MSASPITATPASADTLIGAIEDALVARLAAAFTLPGQALAQVEVRAWPPSPRAYKLTHPKGAVLAIYKGARFEAGGTSGHLIAFDAQFELGLMTRTLREPNLPTTAPEASGASGTGAYALLERSRAALIGWQPPQAAGPLSLVAEGFEDYAEGTWSYSLTFEVPLRTVAPVACVPGPWTTDGPNACCTEAPGLARTDFIQP